MLGVVRAVVVVGFFVVVVVERLCAPWLLFAELPLFASVNEIEKRKMKFSSDKKLQVVLCTIFEPRLRVERPFGWLSREGFLKVFFYEIDSEKEIRKTKVQQSAWKAFLAGRL